MQFLRGTPPGERVGGRYTVTQFNNSQAFLDFIHQGSHHVDCLVFQDDPALPGLIEQLKQQEVFFPVIIVQANAASRPSQAVDELKGASSSFDYSAIVLMLDINELSQIGFAIDQAISKFIQLPPNHPQEESQAAPEFVEFPTNRSLSLKAQQLRLAEKLKERLGYLGVYYKRNPQNFLRHMTQTQRETLLRQLKDEYREIILSYFSDDSALNQRIDDFVNVAFFADIPVSQIVEMHMDLMDEFSKQLKIEGRSDEILQDYRLTLIDTIAHLCEMYRRSIPREF
jgi:circadian clock protein KaiA